MKTPNEAAGGARTQSTFATTVKRARESLDAGRLREAFVTLGSLCLTVTQSPEAAYLRIGIAMQMKDWSVAYSLLDELVKIVPNRAVIHLDRATCLIALRRLTEAHNILANEERRLHGRYPYHVLLALVAALENDPALAARHVRRAIQMESSGAWAITLLCPELSGIVHEAELKSAQ